MTNITEMLIQKAKHRKEILDFLAYQNPEDVSLLRYPTSFNRWNLLRM